MKLVPDSGLWSTGQPVPPSPVVAVIEVSGAVLSWTVDDPSADAQIAFTSVARADWLWRALGEAGHRAVASAVDASALEGAHTVEVAGVDVLPGSLDPL